MCKINKKKAAKWDFESIQTLKNPIEIMVL